MTKQCSNGEKEEPERSVSERQRREASRRRRRRGLSAEGSRSFNAPIGVWVRAEPGHQTTFGAFFVSMQLGVWGAL